MTLQDALEQHCPFCSQANACSANQDCWCMTSNINKSVREYLNAHTNGQCCICESCLKRISGLHVAEGSSPR